MSFWFSTPECDLPEEILEDIRMNTKFNRSEIVAYRKRFIVYACKVIDMPVIIPVPEPLPLEVIDEEVVKEENKLVVKDGGSSTTTSLTSLPSITKLTPPPTSTIKQATQPNKNNIKLQTIVPESSLPPPQTQTQTQTQKQTRKRTKQPKLINPMKISHLQFLHIPNIQINPLKHRLAHLFDFALPLTSSITFQSYMMHLSGFNVSGNRDQKLKLAFRIQDINGDDRIDMADLKGYFDLIARDGLATTEVGRKGIKEVCRRILNECSSDGKKMFLTVEDFGRVVGVTDFDSNLRIEI